MVLIFQSKYLKLHFTSLLLVVFFQFEITAQIEIDSTRYYPIKSISEIFKKKDTFAIIKPIKNNFFLMMPIIGSQPSTGFAYGLIGQYTFKGKNPKDRFSSLNLSATFTEKKQMIVSFKNNVMLNKNKYFLSGDWRYYIFSLSNYGLGTDIIPPYFRDTFFDLDELKEPMDYNYFKFHQTISMRITKNYYAGAGIHLDWYSNIEDKILDVDNKIFTHHYSYNHKNGYDDNQYAVNGVSFNFLYDSRDSQINANSGMFANINYRINPAFDKSNQNSSNVLFMEYRYFQPLSKFNKQHVLSLWTYGQFVTSGNLPYLNLPAIGWDQRSRSGKGYTQGIFRGQRLVYLETEYRFPITKNQLISGTVFTNFTTTSDSNRNIRIFQYMQPAAGIGLRILIDKATRTNFILNYAWGRHSKAFYLNAGESF